MGGEVAAGGLVGGRGVATGVGGVVGVATGVGCAQATASAKNKTRTVNVLNLFLDLSDTPSNSPRPS